MINYNTIGGGEYQIRKSDFLLDIVTLQNLGVYSLSSQDWANSYVLPISFFCYNDAGDNIDKVKFFDDYNNNDYSHEQTLAPDEYRLIGFFNQNGIAPSYDPVNYGQPINISWLNTGHTYTGKGLYIRIFYYFSKKLF